MTFPKNAPSLDEVLLRSHLCLSGVCPSLEDAYRWYLEQRAMTGFDVEVVPLAEVKDWTVGGDPLRMTHRSGKFFALEGIRVETSYGPVRSWDQPIINQPEVGILGFLTREFDGVLHFLVQAKREPGNINVLQLAPTVQATRSNYTKVHMGKDTPYLDYFVSSDRSRTLLDQLQTEQGSRFLGKHNRNMIVQATHEVEPREGFRWLTLGQIKALLELDNVVNMDARSVLSLVPLVDPEGGGVPPSRGCWADMDDRARELCKSFSGDAPAQSTMPELLAWLGGLKARHAMTWTQLPLDRLRGWTLDRQSIRHEADLHFSIIGLNVSAYCRESASWSQPILHHARRGLRGFFVRRMNGVIHLLAKASLDPGSLNGVEIGPTVSCSDALARRGGALAPDLLDRFLDPDPADVVYRCVHSEEGGRFHHFENEYVFLNAPYDLSHPGDDYAWMTPGQLLMLCRQGHLNIEARNLLSCLNILPNAGSYAKRLQAVAVPEPGTCA